MKVIALQILHWIWFRRDNIYSLYKSMKENPNIKFDGKVTLDEALEYFKEIKNSGFIQDKEDEIVGANDYTQELETKLPKNKHKLLVEYTQTKNSCAIYGATRAFMYNSGVKLSSEEIEEISEYCIDMGYRKRGQGMTFRNANKGASEWIKVNKKIETIVERVPYNSVRYKELKKLGYACALGGYLTREKILDAMDDGVIDNEYTWKEVKKGGHCWTEQEPTQFTDNYPKGKRNHWENAIFDQFIKHNYHFSWCYFLIPVGIESEIKLKDAREAKKLGIWSGERPQDNVSREESAAMIYRGLK